MLILENKHGKMTAATVDKTVGESLVLHTPASIDPNAEPVPKWQICPEKYVARCPFA